MVMLLSKAVPGEANFLFGPVDGVLGATVGVEAARERGSIPILAGLWDTRTKVQAIAELLERPRFDDKALRNLFAPLIGER